VDFVAPEVLERIFSPFIHVFDADGSRVVNMNGEGLPGYAWQVGELHLHRMTFSLPSGAPGPFTIRLGQYDGLHNSSIIFNLPDGRTMRSSPCRRLSVQHHDPTLCYRGFNKRRNNGVQPRVTSNVATRYEFFGDDMAAIRGLFLIILVSVSVFNTSSGQDSLDSVCDIAALFAEYNALDETISVQCLDSSGDVRTIMPDASGGSLSPDGNYIA
jgi:hypothetical protein